MRFVRTAVPALPPVMRRVRRAVMAAGSALAALLLAVGSAQALTLTGSGEVIDSDLILLDGHRVYLLGVESIEANQTCEVDGRPWECYPAAFRMLQTFVAEGPLTCEVVSGPDFLLQVIATCTVAGEDIGERLVRSGFAVAIPAETAAYDEAMATAQAERVGLWQGRFWLPAEWRAATGILADRPAFRPAAP